MPCVYDPGACGYSNAPAWVSIGNSSAGLSPTPFTAALHSPQRPGLQAPGRRVALCSGCERLHGHLGICLPPGRGVAIATESEVPAAGAWLGGGHALSAARGVTEPGALTSTGLAAPPLSNFTLRASLRLPRLDLLLKLASGLEELAGKFSTNSACFPSFGPTPNAKHLSHSKGVCLGFSLLPLVSDGTGGSGASVLQGKRFQARSVARGPTQAGGTQPPPDEVAGLPGPGRAGPPGPGGGGSQWTGKAGPLPPGQGTGHGICEAVAGEQRQVPLGGGPWKRPGGTCGAPGRTRRTPVFPNCKPGEH